MLDKRQLCLFGTPCARLRATARTAPQMRAPSLSVAFPSPHPQEIMSDPSYAGQTVCFTAVHIGNTGVNEDDMESAKAWLDGIVIRSLSPLVRRRARRSPSRRATSDACDEVLQALAAAHVPPASPRSLSLFIHP